jgi:hypothetical protein
MRKRETIVDVESSFIARKASKLVEELLNKSLCLEEEGLGRISH